MSEDRDALRTLVRGTYDLQKLRIQIGNRVVGQFKSKVLGQVAGKSEDELEDDATFILKDLRQRYRKLMDGLKTFPTPKKFRGDEVISSYTELALLHEYIDFETSEAEHFKHMGKSVAEFPIWTEFLEGVRGCGPAMSGVIISEIDITKARYASSLWSYTGLDVVTKWILQGTKVVRTNFAKQEPKLDLPMEIGAIDREDGCAIDGGEVLFHDEVEYEPKVIPQSMEGGGKKEPVDTRQIYIVRFNRDGFVIDATYRQFSFGGRSRRVDHLVDVEYTNKKGERAVRKSITFNPFLKTKLTGVLGPSFLKSSSEYADIYYDYKGRLENHVEYSGDSKGHRHNMAIRYMVKMFLVDLYTKWRAIEGLPVNPPYSEAKLGMPQHVA